MDNTLRYAGKRVIVTGAASGIGAATAALLVELGAEVHAVDSERPDIAAIASFSECHLGDPEQIHATVAKIGSVVNALFNCAGVPNTYPDLSVMLVNFCGLREITEAVVPYMLDGSAIASVASTAGIGWPANMHELSGLLATPDFETARAWCEARADDLTNAYGLSQEAINAYTAMRSFTLAAQGIRINCLNADPIDTPVPLGRHPIAREQAWPLVFLNSPCASFVTGVQFESDGGFKAGLLTGQIDASVLMPEAS